MDFWVASKITLVIRYSLHSLHRNITHLNILTRKTIGQKCSGKEHNRTEAKSLL